MQDNTKLFEFIYESVNNESGDGDLALVLTAQNHRTVADQFEKFLATKPFGCWKRSNQEDGDIIFSDGEESFTISNHDHFCYWSDLRKNPEYHLNKVPCTQKVVVP